jgi:hypothetical protein
MSMPKQRSRRGEPLPPDAALVLRGDELDPGLLTETAQENSVIYGFFGISVFVEVGGFSWETIASERLVRAEWLAIFTVGDLLRAGLELWDTGRAPHYDVVHERCSELVARFVGCPHRLVENPHYEPPEGGA